VTTVSFFLLFFFNPTPLLFYFVVLKRKFKLKTFKMKMLGWVQKLKWKG